MMAHEPFVTTGPDFKGAIEADEKAQGDLDSETIEPLALAKPLVAYALVPRSVRKDGAANLLLGVWIGNPDGTAQLVAFYLNPSGASEPTGWSTLATKIARSITVGTRGLDAKAGERKLGDLTVAVPAGLVLTTEQGPDFTVYHLRKLTVIGQGALQCGVYVGDHPSYQYKQVEVDSKRVERAPGKLLGATVDWQTWRSGGRVMTEAIAKHGSARVHAFCSAKSEPELAELRKLMQGLK
jgi:hypothetical protein